MAQWKFLTNHAHVLLCITRQLDTRMRTIADVVGITEASVHRIVTDLADAGYLTRHRLGWRNYYEVHPDAPLRHPLEADHQVGELLKVLVNRDDPIGGRARAGPAAEQATSRRSQHSD